MNAKKVNENILREMRHCLKSRICVDAENILPDYECTRNHKPCLLYREPFCAKYELFPECMDH